MGIVLKRSGDISIDYNLEILVFEEEIIEARSEIRSLEVALNEKKNALRTKEEKYAAVLHANAVLLDFLSSRSK